MSKEQKVNRKDILPQLEQIKAKTEEFAALVEALPDCYVRNSYQNSVKNLRTKNDSFLTIGGPRKGLTDEEKAVLAAMRAGKTV
jgi:DNA-binding NarL/FixJ family response regulator